MFLGDARVMKVSPISPLICHEAIIFNCKCLYSERGDLAVNVGKTTAQTSKKKLTFG